MIIQPDDRLSWRIQDWGCNVLVCAWWAVLYGVFEFAPAKFNAMVDRWIQYGLVTPELEILNYDAIYMHLGLKVIYNDRHDTPAAICRKDQFEHLCWENGQMKHFTAGNGSGIVTYDPYGFSKTVREGQLKSKRIMTIV